MKFFKINPVFIYICLFFALLSGCKKHKYENYNLPNHINISRNINKELDSNFKAFTDKYNFKYTHRLPVKFVKYNWKNSTHEIISNLRSNCPSALYTFYGIQCSKAIDAKKLKDNDIFANFILVKRDYRSLVFGHSWTARYHIYFERNNKLIGFVYLNKSPATFKKLFEMNKYFIIYTGNSLK